jgi:quercetin dioxygenase-like cupin family protein
MAVLALAHGPDSFQPIDTVGHAPMRASCFYNREVQSWELDRLRIAAHHPQILRSDDDANRVIALLLPQGELLQEHQVHEHALVFVLRGELLVSAGASERALSAPSLIHFNPGERHEVRAITECQLVLCLAPWPGPGHPSRPATA